MLRHKRKKIEFHGYLNTASELVMTKNISNSQRVEKVILQSSEGEGDWQE